MATWRFHIEATIDNDLQCYLIRERSGIFESNLEQEQENLLKELKAQLAEDISERIVFKIHQ